MEADNFFCNPFLGKVRYGNSAFFSLKKSELPKRILPSKIKITK